MQVQVHLAEWWERWELGAHLCAFLIGKTPRCAEGWRGEARLKPQNCNRQGKIKYPLPSYLRFAFRSSFPPDSLCSRSINLMASDQKKWSSMIFWFVWIWASQGCECHVKLQFLACWLTPSQNRWPFKWPYFKLLLKNIMCPNKFHSRYKVLWWRSCLGCNLFNRNIYFAFWSIVAVPIPLLPLIHVTIFFSS